MCSMMTYTSGGLYYTHRCKVVRVNEDSTMYEHTTESFINRLACLCELVLVTISVLLVDSIAFSEYI